MQREISDRVFLGQNVSPFENAGLSDAIDRTASNYNDAEDKVKKIRECIKTENYGADIARYIPRVLEVKFQGMLDVIDTREKVANSSYTNMEELDFQILLTDNCYGNPSSIHIYFPIKIKKSSNNLSDVDSDLITVNNFFVHLIKEIRVTKYGSDKELAPTFLPMKFTNTLTQCLNIFQKTHLKRFKKHCFIGNKVSISIAHQLIEESIMELVSLHRPNCSSNNHCKSKQWKRFKYWR